MYITIEYLNIIGQNGGLGDRIIGFISILMLAKLLNRKPLIKWDYPNVQDILNYKEYDYYLTPGASIASQWRGSYIGGEHTGFFKNTNLIEYFKPFNNIIFNCNTNLGQYIYLNKNHHPTPKEYLDDLVYFYENLYKIYWIPINNLKLQYDLYKPLFGIEKKTIGIHLRCGNLNFGYNETGTFNIDQTPKLLEAVNKILENFSFDGWKVFLACDHDNIKTSFFEKFNKYEIIYVKGDIIHLDKTSSGTELTKVFLDNMLLASTDLMIITYSNLSRTARIMNNKKECYAINVSSVNPNKFVPAFNIPIINEICITPLSIIQASAKDDIDPEILKMEIIQR